MATAVPSRGIAVLWEARTGRTISSAEEAVDAARALGDELGAAVLAKGGHLEGDEVIDQLVTREGVHSWTDRRIETRHTHGTGCTLASAIAAGLGPGMTLPDAVAPARAYVRAAILASPGLGQGHGHLRHALGAVGSVQCGESG